MKDSKETIGSPPTAARVLYKCKFHGYFVKYLDKNALSGFSEKPILLD